MVGAQPSQPQQTLSGLPPLREGEQRVGEQPFLLVRAGACICAVPLSSVSETMRPLPIQVMRGMPSYVVGVSVIRGHSVPVLNLGTLLCAGAVPEAQRFVVLRVDGRHVALAVETVLGVFRLDTSTPESVPPLLRDVQSDLVAGIGSLDRELLLTLELSRIVPAEVWKALEGAQESQ